MSAHMPSIHALESHDDALLNAELRLARLRSQVAVVRTITDHVERLAQPPEADGLKGQLVEEMARLGCCLVEAAAALVERSRPEESGVLAWRPSFGDAE
jgi:hypothetical protein